MEEFIAEYRNYLRWKADKLPDEKIISEPEFAEFVVYFVKHGMKQEEKNNG